MRNPIKFNRFFHLMGTDGPDRIRQWEFLDVTIDIFGRWYRLGVFLGSAGSKKGFWYTNSYGLKGVNFRITLGSYYRRLTILAHTKKR